MLLDELDVRRSAMAYVADRAERNGGVVTRAELEAFAYDGIPLKLIDKGRGIRNPRQLSAVLTILSTLNGPYEDALSPDGLLRYAYQSRPADQGDNVKLRAAAGSNLPLILLQSIDDGVFAPTFPAYVVRDVPEGRYVEIALDVSLLGATGAPTTPLSRQYAERLTKLRLHQPVFRARVLRAYDKACTICRLKHVDLLDAAHILGDAEGGEPDVTNGLAMCKIHHAAYDKGIVGIRPDYVVEVREDVLLEVDGPMLKHGIQETHGWRLNVPARASDRPDRDLLARRYAAFTS